MRVARTLCAHPFLQAGGAAAGLLGDIDPDMLKALAAGDGDGAGALMAGAGGGSAAGGAGAGGASAADMLARLQTGLKPIEQYAVSGGWGRGFGREEMRTVRCRSRHSACCLPALRAAIFLDRHGICEPKKQNHLDKSMIAIRSRWLRLW